MHLIGFIIRIYHDARSPERQIKKKMCFDSCVDILRYVLLCWRLSSTVSFAAQIHFLCCSE